MENQLSAVSIGKFECLHRGHQKLIAQIRAQKKYSLQSTVITIEPPENGRPQVFTPGERQQILKEMGVDRCVSLPMTESFRSMEPEAFVEEILVKSLHTKYLTAGVDFHFGKDRRGDGALLKRLGGIYGFKTEILEKEMRDGREISSTWVHEALAAGKIELVNELLGYRYFLSGEVMHGNHIGSRLGMPTLNLPVSEKKLLPPNGVYVSLTEIDGKTYEGVTNIGCRPTVQEEKKQIGAETHLFDYTGELYGKKVRVSLCRFLRPERVFDDFSCLKHQILSDIDESKRYFVQNS